MNKFNNKRTNNKFYTNKSSITVPDLSQAQVTPSTFPEKNEFSAKNLVTPWNSYRSFDAQTNKIDVNITGYAPLFGKPNSISSLNLGESFGLFTGVFNDLYNTGNFSMLATINRNIHINYWGLNFTVLTDSNKVTKLNDHAFHTWERNMSTLMSLLDQSMYTDLRFFDYAWQASVDGKEGTQFSRYNVVMTPQSYMLVAYQLQLQELLVTMLNFEMLTAQLPLLQEMYKDKADYIVAIQNQLKRSKYTSLVKSILTWLKKRFVDKNFFKNYILPTSVMSKETDGLNSPIVYLTHNFTIPMEPICLINRTTGDPYSHSFTVPVSFFFDKSYIKYDDGDGAITAINGTSNGSLLHRRMNSFNINTILDILLFSNNQTDFDDRIKAWFDTADSVLSHIYSAALDISNKAWFRDTEAALQKLASQPSGINWVQNVETSSISGMFKYANYELVNTLATAMIPTPTWNDNGYSINVPMFRKSGLQNTLIHEHAQAFYLPSDDRSMSFIRVGNTIDFTTRQNIRLRGTQIEDRLRLPILQLQNVELSFDPQHNPQYNYGNVSLSDYNTQAYLVLQDNIPIVRDTNNQPVTWYNSDLITIIPIMFQNRWADYAKLATENFIIPLA